MTRKRNSEERVKEKTRERQGGTDVEQVRIPWVIFPRIMRLNFKIEYSFFTNIIVVGEARDMQLWINLSGNIVQAPWNTKTHLFCQLFPLLF